MDCHPGTRSILDPDASREGSPQACPGLTTSHYEASSSGRAENELPDTTDDSFPDGGIQAWLVVTGSFCGFFCSFGWINTLGIFQDYYQRNQLNSLPPSTISWIASLEIFFMMFGGPFTGFYYDNYGPRWLLIGGSALHCFGLLMTSFSTSFYQILLSQGVCSAIGASMILHSSVASVTTWFLRRRALAVGIAVSGSSLGGVVFPIMVHGLIRDTGYAWTMRICSFTILGLMILAVLCIRSRFPPQRRPFRVKQFIKPFKEFTFSSLMLFVLFFYIGVLLPLTYIVILADYYDVEASLAFYTLPILNAASLFGRVLCGYLADQYGRFNVLILLSLVTGLLDLSLWIFARTTAPIIIFSICFGFSSGAFVSITPALVTETSAQSDWGVRIGTHYFVASIASLASIPVGGALLQQAQGDFLGLQIYCGVCQLVGACALIVTRVSLVGVRLTRI